MKAYRVCISIVSTIVLFLLLSTCAGTPRSLVAKVDRVTDGDSVSPQCDAHSGSAAKFSGALRSSVAFSGLGSIPANVVR